MKSSVVGIVSADVGSAVLEFWAGPGDVDKAADDAGADPVVFPVVGVDPGVVLVSVVADVVAFSRSEHQYIYFTIMQQKYIVHALRDSV